MWWWLGARTAAHSPQQKLTRKIDEEEWSNLLQRATPRLVLFHTRIVAGCAATPHVFDGKRLWRLILLGEGGFLFGLPGDRLSPPKYNRVELTTLTRQSRMGSKS